MQSFLVAFFFSTCYSFMLEGCITKFFNRVHNALYFFNCILREEDLFLGVETTLASTSKLFVLRRQHPQWIGFLDDSYQHKKIQKTKDKHSKPTSVADAHRSNMPKKTYRCIKMIHIVEGARTESQYGIMKFQQTYIKAINRYLKQISQSSKTNEKATETGGKGCQQRKQSNM